MQKFITILAWLVVFPLALICLGGLLNLYDYRIQKLHQLGLAKLKIWPYASLLVCIAWLIYRC